MSPGWRPRKVAHLTTVDLSLRHLLWAQLDATRRTGAEVIGISADGPDVAWLEARGIRHLVLRGSTRSRSIRGDVVAAWSLWKLLRRERPDVLHTHNPKPGVYGRIVGRLAGVPVVVNTVHGLYATPDDSLAVRAIVYGLEGVASRFSDAELMQNEEDHALVTRWHLAARDKTVVLGNGVDLSRYRPPTDDERRAARAALGLADADVAVGFVGRLVAEKGVPELLEANRDLAGAVRLLIVGFDDRDKPDALPDALLRGAAADGVMFLGPRDDVERIYHALDVVCLPSHREGFPRVPMEAAASGVPVIASDIRGCRQAVDHGVTGLLVPVGDAGALAAAIRTLTDDAVRAPMRAAARERAVQHFDERDVVTRVLSSYSAGRARRTRRFERSKRIVDVLGASIALVVTSPVFAVAAVVVRLRLGSPILFRQQRPGRDGRIFMLYKLRTMRDAMAADGTPLPDEERLGALGRFLRSTSVDELPELWNVLRGDMSLVGPRPLLIEYLERYDEHQARRHEVKPGLTGLAQVNGRNAQSWGERFAMDVDYVDRRTMVLDATIVLRTFGQVLRRTGIAEEGAATRTPFGGATDR